MSENIAESAERPAGIYIASKTKHAPRWRALRDADGYPIISTWIDEAGAGESGDLADLWRRCIEEASAAKALILYREPEDVLKGAWVELGAALTMGVPVLACGIEEFTIAHSTGIHHCASFEEALSLAKAHCTTDCTRCAGTGEIITDEDRYLSPRPGDVGDEAVDDCPSCDGIGRQWLPECVA